MKQLDSARHIRAFMIRASCAEFNPKHLKLRPVSRNPYIDLSQPKVLVIISSSMKKLLEDLLEIAGDRVSASLAERYCYSCDASQIVGLPDFVVRPENTSQVSQLIRLCSERQIPVTARGAGTGLAGGASPVLGGIVLDMSGMNRILEVDIENQQVIVEPGVVHEKLNLELLPYGFFFPPDPGSSAMCTIGGMLSYNSSGMRSVKYGTVRNYVLDLEVVLSDGRVINTGSKVLKSAAGYDLTRIFVGSEGTLGIITRAGLKIAPLPRTRRLVLACFEEAEIAGHAVIKVFSSGITPSACEILDRTTLQVLKLCDQGSGIAGQWRCDPVRGGWVCLLDGGDGLADLGDLPPYGKEPEDSLRSGDGANLGSKEAGRSGNLPAGPQQNSHLHRRGCWCPHQADSSLNPKSAADYDQPRYSSHEIRPYR